MKNILKYYETHITVLNSQKDFFLEICEKNNIKTTEIGFPSELSLANHLMTSIKHKEEDLNIQNWLSSLEYLFKDIGIIRSKIEVNQSLNFKYIETHLSIDNNKEDLYKNLKLNCDWVVSYNINKTNTFSITSRIYNKKDIIKIENDFKKLETVVNETKLELEYCIYDSNPLLDFGWIN